MDETENTALENLILKHKQEIKEQNVEILKLRQNSKNDKKKRKDAVAQIGKLERSLKEKHAQELEDLNESSNEIDRLNQRVSDLGVEDTDESTSGTRKVTKAQKRRDKKAQQEKDRDKAIKDAEVENIHGVRNQEAQALKRILSERELGIFEIPSDGNCMYAAVNHQLQRQGDTYTVPQLRKLTADHMRDHLENFLPFLCKTETGDPYTEDEFEEYCKKLEATPEWGGHLEIQSLSNVLCRPVEVIQAMGTSILSGEDHQTSPLILSYHRHAYGLGEHYNSVVSASEVRNSEDEDS